MVRTILLPLDGSAAGEAALPLATALAARFGARLLLVRPVHSRVLPSQDAGAARAARLATARDYLRQVAYDIRSRYSCIKVGTVTPLGLPAEAILDEANLQHTDLIVTASRGDDDAEQDRLGHTAESVARRALAPVLIVPPLAGDTGALIGAARPLRVLVPVSGSPAGEAMLPLLARIARRLPIRALVVHVVAQPGQAGQAGSGASAETTGPAGGWPARGRGAPLPAPATYCQRIAGWLARHGVPAVAAVRAGGVVEELNRAAAAGADVIALGVPQETPWSFQGTAERLLRTVAQPVLLLRTSGTAGAVLDALPEALPTLAPKALTEASAVSPAGAGGA
jgi:nucleotide-binding universal stress UspA family protein